MMDGDIDLGREVGAVAALLKAPLAEAEPAFVAAGQRLEEAIGLLSQLTATFASLPERLRHPELGEATRHLETVAATAARLAQTLGDERGRLERVLVLNTDVGRRIDQLRRTVGVINVLAINARIAATEVDRGSDDFAVFTGEIGRLAKAASSTIERFAGEQERLMTLLASARAGLATFEERHKKTLETVARRLEASLASVAQHRHRAATAADEISQRARAITGKIGAVVMALQIGDITRQRLEHVAHALATLIQHVGTREVGPDEAGAGDKAQRVVGAVCRLQSAQVAHAGAAFKGEIAGVRATLDALSRDAEAIVELGLATYGPAAGGDRGGSFLGELAGDLARADVLIRDCETARHGVDQIAASAATTLEGLLRQVHEVRAMEVDMRLVGLNTSLKCVRLGDRGRTLSAIAQELRAYANLTVENAGTVASGLQAVAEAARALNANGDETDGKSARLAELDHETRASIDRLETVGAGLGEAIATLRRRGLEAAALLRETVAGFTPHVGLNAAITRLMAETAERLTRIASRTGAGSSGHDDAQTLKNEVLRLLNGRYTMASERDIHAMFETNDPAIGLGAPLATTAATPAAADIDALLF